MESGYPRVVDEANLEALAAWADLDGAMREWRAGGTPGMAPDVADAQSALRELRAGLADPSVVAAAEARLHSTCLVVAHRLAGARRTLLTAVRGNAAQLDSATPARVISVLVRARRAIAVLAARLHGLPHICLLAARVSIALAAVRTSTTTATQP